ncbi:MAG TPA: beta-ketoacyl synthase N-terminal-like domain-containing protein [Solirubrobacteraceae bacterium]|nr:beta-ketoacyl synthase N-terminal-like domain-containing protein [Solirubrobacteraceae bacterium]
MSAVAVTGLGVVAPTGVGREAFAAALATPRAAEAAPPEGGYGVEDFDIRAQLGRKGTSFLNRCAGLALVACREALEDSGIPLDDPEVAIGVSLGTTSGSLRSMSDYTRDTLLESRPYLVNPGFFPNTVMNCATGQTAIRYGLRGVNATIASGPLAFLGVLRCATRALRLGYLDGTLAGAVEEFSEHRAWQVRLARSDGYCPPPGEGAAVVVLEPAGAARAAGRPVDAEIDSVVVSFAPGGERFPGFEARLERTICDALERAGIGPEELVMSAVHPPPDSAEPELGKTVMAALGARAAMIDLTAVTGDCGAAAGALAFAATLSRHRGQPALDGCPSLLAGWTTEGAVAAAVFRGYSRAGRHER